MEQIVELEKRTHVYLQKPNEYELDGCPLCGNDDPEWSEFLHHLWCPICKIDFVPKDEGMFGIVPLHVAAMMGVRFDRINLETQEIERLNLDTGIYESESGRYVFQK